MPRLKKYKIKYYFDGRGEIEVEAINQSKAEDKFFSGEYDEKDDNEWGNDYCIDTVEEIEQQQPKKISKK